MKSSAFVWLEIGDGAMWATDTGEFHIFFEDNGEYRAVKNSTDEDREDSDPVSIGIYPTVDSAKRACESVSV